MSLLQPGLEAFVAVIEHGTVHGAARAIGLTQTGVTQRIRTLERQLGTTLFIRSRRGMRPTDEGEALLRYCQRVGDLEGELLSFLERDERARDVRLQIAGPSSIMRCRVIPMATRVLERFDGVVFTFNLDDDAPLLGQLKSGASQLAALERREVVDELDSKLLRPAEYVLVASAAWRGRRLKEIVSSERIVDFNPADDATFRYLEQFGLLDLARRERHLANNTDALAALVAGGHGYSVLSREFAAPLLDDGRLITLNRGRSMKIEFALAWYPRHEMPPYFGRLIDEIH
ncbi:MAG: LysR family transcriptional regulator [Deltaproteobacteria bacterium]|nr:LysR family transcriptional regulator [Deltaproteobacteria bacterium]